MNIGAWISEWKDGHAARLSMDATCALDPRGHHTVYIGVSKAAWFVARRFQGLCDKRAADAAERLGAVTCASLLCTLRAQLRGQSTAPTPPKPSKAPPLTLFAPVSGDGAWSEIVNAATHRRETRPRKYRWSRAAQLRDLLGRRFRRKTGVLVVFRHDGHCAAGPRYETRYRYTRDDSADVHEWRRVDGSEIKVVAAELAQISRATAWMLFAETAALKPPWWGGLAGRRAA